MCLVEEELDIVSNNEERNKENNSKPKVIVTVRKTVWNCGFLSLTYTSAFSVKKH